MRASVPALILALTLAAPARAEGGAAPRLSHTASTSTDGNCGPACGPKLSYALIDLTQDFGPAPILAASVPATIPALAASAMRDGGESTQLLAAVRGEEPALQTLAGLVTIAAAPGALPAPAPTRMPIAPPGPSPAAGPSPQGPPAPDPSPTPPHCGVKRICP
jgi:hypothetical protein